jgi:hypothetical protein
MESGGQLLKGLLRCHFQEAPNSRILILLTNSITIPYVSIIPQVGFQIQQ